VLFVADPQNNQILMYNPKTPNPSPEGSITNGLDYTFGLAVDKKGTLYAANLLGNSAGSIAIYPKGSSTPSVTITDGCDAPYGIGVDSKGDIFIANLDNDTIVGYKAGATSPFESIDFSAYGQALGVGVDAKDNVWVGSDTTSRVYEIPAGSTTPQNAGLSGLNGTIGVAFGRKDEMYVSNFGSTNVQVYAYGTTTPSRTITSGLTAPTFGGLTKSDFFFQSNQNGNVSGYKKGQSTPFSTITGIPDPRGIASIPAVKK
jgi:streptogramin lyase